MERGSSQSFAQQTEGFPDLWRQQCICSFVQLGKLSFVLHCCIISAILRIYVDQILRTVKTKSDRPTINNLPVDSQGVTF